MNALAILPMQASQGNPLQQAGLFDPIDEVLEALRQGQLVIVTAMCSGKTKGTSFWRLKKRPLRLSVS